ncbi:transcription antitermination factor NusB [Coprothermobacter platensis]|uniref:transcription antitermination factor NusB n=1 Tax=Coprothermobacter platensis TaxID=108819 RepID=UPI00036E23D8|nr:transcription antitermination factor NusB [Coprothermobacter platensis]
MSRNRGPLFEQGREMLLQELMSYELGVVDKDALWRSLSPSLPKSDRVKRHIKRLLNLYLQERDEVDMWIDSHLKSKSFAAYSDLEKMIMRLAILETMHFGDEKMIPVIASTWVDISERFVDDSFAKAVHGIIGTCYEENHANTGLS